MRLVINTAHQRFGGAVQVALSFVEECKKFPEHEYHIWVGPGIQASLKKETFPPNFFFYEFNFGVINMKIIPKIQKQLAKLEKKIQPDCIISTSGPSYFHSKAPQIIGFNLPLYIYPESPYVQGLSRKKKIKLAVKKRIHYYFFKRDATAFVVQTDDVNKRVKKALKTEKVHTVTNTFSGYYKNPLEFPNKLPPKKPGEIRLLTISAYYPHKDLEIIPKVVKELENRGIQCVKFVLTLKDKDFKNRLEAHESVINIGPIPPEACPALYKECDLMFLPTLAECFSASYPEAMVMEKPIITTDLGFAKSICSNAAYYYQAKNEKAAADMIEMLLLDSHLKIDLIERGHQRLEKFDSAEERANKYLDLCKMYGNERI